MPQSITRTTLTATPGQIRAAQALLVQFGATLKCSECGDLDCVRLALKPGDACLVQEGDTRTCDYGRYQLVAK